MGLRDKASKIDFGALPELGPATDAEPAGQSGAGAAVDTKRPKTAPGAMMAFAGDQRSELLKENEELRAQVSKVGPLQDKLDETLDELRGWDGAKATRKIDARLIARSRYANRHERSYLGADFAALKAEIASAGGNVQPIKVRPLGSNKGAGSGEAEFELVYGHRRHEACLQLGIPVLAVVDNVDDRALFEEMDRENRSRKDLSAWEQGTMYRRALDEGLYPSNRKLADAVGIDLTNLGRALALASLPEGVVGAFASPLELQFRWASPLAKAYQADPTGMLARAEAIRSLAKVPPAKEVFQRLVGSGSEGGSTVLPPSTREIFVEGKRVAVLQVNQRGAASVSFEPAMLDAKKLQSFVEMVERFMSASKDKE